MYVIKRGKLMYIANVILLFRKATAESCFASQVLLHRSNYSLSRAGISPNDHSEMLDKWMTVHDV